MCGIAGQFVLNGGEADAGLVGAMAERLAHRGPDGEGRYFSGPVGLAHRRLAIIDLSLGAESGLALIRHLRSLGIAVLVYSMHEESNVIRRAMAAGAAKGLARMAGPLDQT